MENKMSFLSKTDYFSRPWIWIKRSVLFILILLVLIFLSELYFKDSPLKYIAIISISILIFLIPKDDIAVDSKNFYYIKRSILPFLSTVKTYKLSEIRSIDYRGTYSKGYDLFNFMSLGNIYQTINLIEIGFKNGSSVNFPVGIYIKDIEGIILEARKLLPTN